MRTAAGHLAFLGLLAIVSLAFAELAGGNGGPLLGLVRGSRRPLERTGLAVLLGSAVIGAGLLGLGCAGLFRPWPILALVLAPPAAAALLGRRRGLLLDAVRDAAGLPGLAVPAILLAVIAVAWLLPEREIDAMIYHLAAPAQWLAAGKLVSDHVVVNFHLPLPVEVTFALPLMLGDERLARVVPAVSLAAALAVWAARRRPPHATHAGWLGPLLVLSMAGTAFLLVRSKNDLAAASLALAGAALPAERRGTTFLSSVLFGCAVAAKPVVAPLALAWMAGHRSYRRQPLSAAAGLLAAGMPWALKSWLLLGNPFAPLWFDVLDTAGLDSRNLVLRDVHVSRLWDIDRSGIGAWWRSVAGSLVREHPLLPAGLLAALACRATRRATALTLVAGIGVLWLGRYHRFALPEWMLLALLSSEAVALTGRRAPRLVAAALLAVTLAPPVLRAPAAARELAVLRAPVGAIRERQRTSLGDAARALAGLNTRRLLLVGDGRILPFSGRVLCAGALYETPLIWRLSREAANSARMAVKFRQLGCDLLAYNCVAAQVSIMNAWPQAWSEDQLRRYLDFAGRRLVPLIKPTAIDQVNGGFYVFAVRERDAPAAEFLDFLPGAEGALMAGARALVVQRRPEQALRAYRETAELLPGVGMVQARIADVLFRLGRHREAFETLERLTARGYADDTSLMTHAFAALAIGRNREGVRLLDRAAALYPGERERIQAARERAAAAYD